jgi:ketosteroid isomerase-like protein
VRAGLTEWLDEYGRVWEARDPDGAAQLFAEDAVYQWGPFGRKLRGRPVIREAWADAVEDQRNIKFDYEVLTASARGGIVRWWVAADLPAEGVHSRNEGIFRITFDETGLCNKFEEWFNSAEEPLDSASP